MYEINKALNSIFVSKVITLDIPKTFDKVWHIGLIYELSSYGICGRLYAIIKSFHPRRFMKVFVNCPSSKANVINVGVSLVSLHDLIIFLLFY